MSPDLVQARLRLIEELLADLSGIGEFDVDEMERDRIRRHAVERILTQLVELASSINGHVVGALTGAAPRDYRSSFLAMAELDVIDRELADRLARAAGMRNLLVHEYGDIDLGIVADAVPGALVDFSEYVRVVAGWAAAR